jgi:hypothetical protein
VSKAVVIINNDFARLRASAWLGKAPIGTVITFAKPKRSLEQNALMWALLTDLADQLPWHGLKLSAEDYKDLLTAGLKRELRTVPNTDGNGFVMLGARTSDMSVPEMANFVEFILAFGALHGVTFTSQSGEPNAG